MSRRIRYTCDACAAPILDGNGWVTCDYIAGVGAYVEARVLWETAHGPVTTLAELASYPQRPRWEVFHAACDPHPDRAEYVIDIPRIDTEAAVIGWTAHLAEKTWFSDTDWSGFLYRHVLAEVAV